ncbi:eCIS core domain-containing protein [Nannocystaceae bacterium ST9]
MVDEGRTLVQARMHVGQPDDAYEREADRIAERIVDMPGSTPAPRPTAITPAIQRKCEACEREDEALLQREGEGPAPRPSLAGAAVDRVRGSGGHTMSADLRAMFEPHFARDFSRVRVHTDGSAASSARSLNARAFTVGHDMVFGANEYQPGTREGRKLIAHELTHVVQQSGGGSTSVGALASASPDRIQRKLDSPRFKDDPTLDAVDKGTKVLRTGANERAVLLIQHALYDIGFKAPTEGADGIFGNETVAAVKAFQKAATLTQDGEVGQATLGALDAKFKTPVLPSSSDRGAAWTEACVLGMLCPWSPHTVDTLKTITVKSFDSIRWDDEAWDGAKWVVDPFPGGGYQGGGEIGLLNDTCESVAETLYHETLHANQPSSHKTMYDKEFYAYRIGEEFSIALGLTGRAGLRGKSSGLTIADTAKVSNFVKTNYPSVSSSGLSSEEIIDKGVAPGTVKVKTGSVVSERPAKVGDKVPGPIALTNEKVHDTTKWKCP